MRRLDLGSVLVPMPEAGQVQVELTDSGVPSCGVGGDPQRAVHHRGLRGTQIGRAVA